MPAKVKKEVYSPTCGGLKALDKFTKAAKNIQILIGLNFKFMASSYDIFFVSKVKAAKIGKQITANHTNIEKK